MYAPLDRRLVTGSLAALGISPADSRFAHARKSAQHVCAFGAAFGHKSKYYIRKAKSHGSARIFTDLEIRENQLDPWLGLLR
jgi:hypothetical protein